MHKSLMFNVLHFQDHDNLRLFNRKVVLHVITQNNTNTQTQNRTQSGTKNHIQSRTESRTENRTKNRIQSRTKNHTQNQTQKTTSAEIPFFFVILQVITPVRIMRASIGT